MLRLKKDSATGTKVFGSWQAACIQRSRRGFVVIQDKLMKPRAPSAFWSAPASDGRGTSSNSVTVWWMGRDQNKGISMFKQ